MAGDTRSDQTGGPGGRHDDGIRIDLDDEPGGAHDEIHFDLDDEPDAPHDEIDIDLDDVGDAPHDEVDIDLDDVPTVAYEDVHVIADQDVHVIADPEPAVQPAVQPPVRRVHVPAPLGPVDEMDVGGRPDARWPKALVAGLAIGAALGFVAGYAFAPAPGPTKAIVAAPAPAGAPAPATPAIPPAPVASPAAPADAAKEEVELRLPPVLHGEPANGPAHEVRVSAAAISLEGMASVAAVGGGWPGTSGTPPTLPVLREALGDGAVHLLGHEDASYGAVAPALFSLAAPGSPVTLGARLMGAPAAAPYRLLPVTPLTGEEPPSQVPEVEVEFPILKVKVGGGYSAAAATVKRQVKATRKGITGCVQQHAPQGTEGKLKLTLKYDPDSGRLVSKVRKDTFDGAEPMPCIVGVLEAMEPGEPKGGAGSV